MQRKGAVVIPILIVLMFVFSAFSTVLFYFYQKEHTLTGQLKEQLGQLESRHRTTEDRLAEFKKTASDLSFKLQESNSKINSLNDELSRERQKLNETSGQLEQFKTDLENQKSLRAEIENKLKAAQDEGKQVKEQIKIIQQQKNDLEEKIKNLESGSGGVELGKVIVNSETTAAENAKVSTVADNKAKVKPKPPLEGKVLIVNREFNFVVINLGSRDNIKLGDEFTLYHEGNLLGNVKVEKVHETMSAAGFPLELKDLIKENDKIVQKAA